MIALLNNFERVECSKVNAVSIDFIESLRLDSSAVKYIDVVCTFFLYLAGGIYSLGTIVRGTGSILSPNA